MVTCPRTVMSNAYYRTPSLRVIRDYCPLGTCPNRSLVYTRQPSAIRGIYSEAKEMHCYTYYNETLTYIAYESITGGHQSLHRLSTGHHPRTCSSPRGEVPTSLSQLAKIVSDEDLGMHAVPLRPAACNDKEKEGDTHTPNDISYRRDILFSEWTLRI
ncbi:hypothetical protein CBL_11959 [Carabus blaptoides fortunei]